MPFRPAFESFVAPARRQPALWRLLVGVLVIAAVYLLWLAVMAGALAVFVGPSDVMLWVGRMAVGVDPAPMFLLFATFVGLALGPIVAARLLHHRGAGTLFGRGAPLLRDFVRAALTVWVVYALLLVPLNYGTWPVPNLDPWLWLRLLPLSLLGVVVQTMAEELVFRGYLMQQLAARFRSPLIWLIVPALAFGALHYDPRINGINTWPVIAAVLLFGLIAADLTRRTGSIGASWGVHFANNCIALLVVATGGALPGLALYTTPYMASDPAVLSAVAADAAALVLVWAILVRLLRR